MAITWLTLNTFNTYGREVPPKYNNTLLKLHAGNAFIMRWDMKSRHFQLELAYMPPFCQNELSSNIFNIKKKKKRLNILS